MRPKSLWDNAHVRLKKIYDERVPLGMSQKEFGRLYGIGGQSMVAQYLSGAKPLHYDVAAKFARGLNCAIEDICPEMANNIRLQILPYLGKKLRRAALLVLALQLGGQPYDANAVSHNSCDSDNVAKNLTKSRTYYTFQDICKRVVRLFRYMALPFHRELSDSEHLSLTCH